MELRPTPHFLRAPRVPEHPLHSVAELLVGHGTELDELPPFGELAEALLDLSARAKDKALLPVSAHPVEFALTRRGADLLVSWYETGSLPEVLVLGRVVPLEDALAQAATVARALAARADSRALAEIHLHLAERLDAAEIAEATGEATVPREGGDRTGDDGRPLSFGFEAQIPPAAAPTHRGANRADVHSMLFHGSLWAWLHGRKVTLVRGPVLLAAQRMLAAARALVDAEAASRAVHVRLRSGNFHVSVRRERDGVAQLTLGPEGREPVTLSETSAAALVLPILRLASELCRALTSVDRSQTRNLRIRALRDDVRLLRRRLRERTRTDGFRSSDPDRIRKLTTSERPNEASAPVETRGLRFGERWRVEIDELDPHATFLCGDRIVLGTPRRTLAVSREDGRVLWVKEGASATSLMVGVHLVRVSQDGEVAICDVNAGHTVAETRIRTSGAAIRGIRSGSQTTPPSLVLTEGPSRVVAIDVRTGEHRWRYALRGLGPVHMVRRGRLLLVTGGDGTVTALDIQSGEPVWRMSEEARFSSPVCVVGRTVVATAGEAGAAEGGVYGIDLYSGERRWQASLSPSPVSAPFAVGAVALVSAGVSRRAELVALDGETGEARWRASDPGLGAGADCMEVGDAALVNAPSGRVLLFDLATGEVRWERRLSHPVTDEIPRRLEPVLRGGAVFVPSAKVHVLRAADGEPVGRALPCDLVPDVLRVDERGWVYVAEESGTLAAYSPAPQLTLVT